MLLRPHRSPRSHLTLLAAGALLASPLLSACGFNYATDRINTISAGINDRSGQIDVLGAVVIADQDDVGLFVATLVNKNQGQDENGDPVPGTELTGFVATEDLAPADTDPEPIPLPAGGRVSLIEDDAGIEVTGTFSAGDFVEATLSFADGQVTTLTVPVVTACHQYLPEKTGVTPPPGEDVEGTEEPDGEPGEYSCEASEPNDPHGEAEPVGEVEE